MKTYFILSAMGKDRPGIVADVSEVIYECGGNIEDSRTSLLRNHFTLLLLFSTEREEVNQKLSSALKRLEWEKSLTVFYSSIPFEEAYPRIKDQLLADYGINIANMETQRVLSAESGTSLFEMDIDIEVPRSISEQGLREGLHRLANELVIDLVLKKEI
jgi:glycine cleavage system transcriptional repressor